MLQGHYPPTARRLERHERGRRPLTRSVLGRRSLFWVRPLSADDVPFGLPYFKVRYFWGVTSDDYITSGRTLACESFRRLIPCWRWRLHAANVTCSESLGCLWFRYVLRLCQLHLSRLGANRLCLLFQRMLLERIWSKKTIR
jgi:hypothetical protein